MYKKLTQMIKQAFKTLVSNDTELYPIGQGSYNGKTTNYTRLNPYGLCSNAPLNSHILLFSSQAQESVKFGIEHDAAHRLKGLKEGEVALYNTLTKAFVFLKEDGSIEANSPTKVEAIAPIVDITASESVTVTAPVLNVNAATSVTLTSPVVNVAGSLAVTGSAITHNGKEIGATHGHTQGPDSNGDTEQSISGVV